MDWKHLLSDRKLAESPALPDQFARFPINTFELDYSNLVSSAAFRRLQDKTQVYPLDKGDFVRTRLTHSIEVSTVARQLGMMVTDDRSQYARAELQQYRTEIPSVLACVALLHDLGNPPFGHFGEALIGEWFRGALDRLTYKGQPLRQWLTPQMARDLENFEGNAQALRLLGKAARGGSINLSMAVIGALLKYPTDSMHFNRKDPDIRRHKLGYFAAEEEIFRTVTDTLAMHDAAGAVCRHPLTYLMEAADDIAYATADLEDALNKGLFTMEQFLNRYRGAYRDQFRNGTLPHGTPADYSERLLQELEQMRQEAGPDRDEAALFHTWLLQVRNWLMYVAIYRFNKSYDEIMAGTYQEDLFYQTNHVLTLQILKDITAEYAYDSAGILRLELAAESIVTFLLEKYVHAVLCFDEAYQDALCQPTSSDRKYLATLPREHLLDYRRARTGDEKTDLYLRILMATDFLSGMTDGYARTLYREARGID
ncbi:MAG TPA: dNTP triphosphohydrolase [Candidatus Gemmiger excrementigallinarum]|uniref:DNTP triphosphohydrolase n=1 Tax=Candidatus Gemmiger excrementigallinarum TaxID=2838609 RepID=A0A9D2EQL7_9FIRM|nr:dNTP triphosphohydrolase [Candidatus Gemmiger excrementigallinarum]